MKAPYLLILLTLLPIPARAALILFDIPPGSKLYHCNVQVTGGQKDLDIRNIMSIPGSVDPAKPEKAVTPDKITITFPIRYRNTVGVASRCLSLSAKSDFVFMSEKDAKKYLLPLGDKRYLDVCWKFDTGQRDPRVGKIHDAGIIVTPAIRTIKEGRVSLDWGDYDKNKEVMIYGSGSKSQVLAENLKLNVACAYHTITPDESKQMEKESKEDLRRALERRWTTPQQSDLQELINQSAR